MPNIQLEGRTIECNYNRGINTLLVLLERYEKGEGVILSEADIRLLEVRNYENASELTQRCWDTSTLSATKGETVKVILPYETDSRILTDAARFGLGLIDYIEFLDHPRVNLDIDGGWEQLEGSGVYTRPRDEWFEKGEGGVLVGLDAGMIEEQAMKCPILLTRLGHPDYVDSGFARSGDEVAEIIGRIFELGKQEHHYRIMMSQYLPRVRDKGFLSPWYIHGLSNGASSYAGSYLDGGFGRFAFDSGDKARIQLESLEQTLKPDEVNEIRIALDDRNQLRKKILTTDQIYSAIGDYVGLTNEQEVRKAIDDLTSQ